MIVFYSLSYSQFSIDGKENAMLNRRLAGQNLVTTTFFSIIKDQRTPNEWNDWSSVVIKASENEKDDENEKNELSVI